MVEVLYDPPAEGLPRKKGSILLLHPIASGSSLQRSVKKFAETVSAKLYLCARLSELPTILPQIQSGISLAICSLRFLDVLEATRLLHAAAPLAEILFPTSADQEENLRSQLGPVPRIGNHWRCADPESPAFFRVLGIAYRGGEQRRTVRTTLDRFNARLKSTPAAVDPLQLRKLVISDSFLASVLEHATDAVLSTDLQNQIVSFNPAAERLFGISQRDALNRPAASLAGMEWVRDVDRLLKAGKTISPASATIALPDSTRKVEISVSPIHDEAGSHIATTMMIRDVTERLQTEEALRKAEALAAAGRLAATISHEINNPLEAITNLLYLLGGENVNERGREYLKLANAELERVSHIVKQTLVFYRNKNHDPHEVFDAREAIEHILRIYARKISAKSIDLKLIAECDSRVRMMKADFQQVISNLISNAIDACPVKGKIEIRSNCTSDAFWVSVQDNGGGVPEELKSKIFSPFFTTKQDVGTGLGLWVTKDIAERYGGSISVRNSEAGAVFRVEIPQNALACGEDEVAESLQASQPPLEESR